MQSHKWWIVGIRGGSFRAIRDQHEVAIHVESAVPSSGQTDHRDDRTGLRDRAVEEGAGPRFRGTQHLKLKRIRKGLSPMKATGYFVRDA